MNQTYRDLLDAAARQHLPDEIDLFPRIAAQAGRRTLVQAARTRPALVILVVLLALGLLSGVAYAVGRSLGYIPGIGIVEEGTPWRVLAEPVIVQREGITLTVTQALASSEKTIVSYRVENIPESALAKDFMEGQTPTPRCALRDHLQLPDGTLLSPTGGQGGGWQLGFEYRETFPPLPSDVQGANLLVSCLLDTAPGMAPENWVIPLAFVPAPPDMTVIPVIEISPTVPATPGEASGPAAVTSPISVEKSIELTDGYILIGSFHSITTADGLATSPYVWDVRIADASGQDVPYLPADVDLPAGTQTSSPWAYKIVGKAFTWPLTITIDALEAAVPGPQASFEFDTGLAPQPDQQWTLNQDLQVGRTSLRVLTVTRTLDGYAFTFQADPAVISVTVDIQGTGQYLVPAGGGGGGGDGSLSASLAYAGQVPEGQLTVVLGVSVSITGPWSVEWTPETAPAAAGTAAPPSPAPCVTDETWAQAQASTSPAIPAGLPGSFVLFGPNTDGTLYGIALVNLVDMSRQFLGAGSWPAASPDGMKIAHTGDLGLVVLDLVNGTTLTLPGTDSTVFRTVWSTDSSRLAYIRSGTDQMMVVNADGTDPQQVRDNSAVYHLLVGWADSTHLLITEPGPEGVLIQSLNLDDGSTRNLFTMSSNKADTVVSADGQWIAFTSSLGGALGNGLYISHLDGSERRMVAALDGRALYLPVWSPDNRWLILSLPDPNDQVDQMAQALLELETCRLIPLPDLEGDVYSWGSSLPD